MNITGTTASKYTILSGHLCILLALISDLTILGNAFSYYFLLPRYLVFFLLIFIGFILLKPSIPRFSTSYPIWFFLTFFAGALVIDFAFGLPFLLYGLKVILVCFMILGVTKRESTLIFIANGFISLSNIGWILGALSFFLPDFLSFSPAYLDDLRRMASGYGTFYWSNNFSGLFLIGDEMSPLGEVFSIPKYAGYFNEPAINAFSLCASLAILIAFGNKISYFCRALISVNFLLTYSLTGFATITVLVIFLMMFKGQIFRLFQLAVFACLGIFFVFPSILSFEYLIGKVDSSFAFSLSLFRYVFSATLTGQSSFNARVGDFDYFDINFISSAVWMLFYLALSIAFVGACFCGFFLSRYPRGGLSTPQRVAILLTPIILFSIKSLNHYLFSPLSIVTLLAIVIAIDFRKSVNASA